MSALKEAEAARSVYDEAVRLGDLHQQLLQNRHTMLEEVLASFATFMEAIRKLEAEDADQT